MRIPGTKIPLYELKGSWYEMGRQYGQDDPEGIQHSINWWHEKCCMFGSSETIETHIAMAAPYEEEIKNYSKDVYDFMRGMSDGSGVSMELILFNNVGCEVMINCAMKAEAERGSALGAPMGCTSYAIYGDLTEDGKLICGQNLDMEDGPKIVALRMIPESGPRMLGFTWAGCPLQMCINENGMGVFVNVVQYGGIELGVPETALTQKAIASDMIGDACDCIAMAKRSQSFNYLIADKSDIALSLEVTPDRFGVAEPTDGILCHTNHYLTPWLEEGAGSTGVDSYARHQRFMNLAKKSAGHINVETVKSFLRDHVGYPHSICKHPHPKYGMTDHTLLSCIAIPEDGVIYACCNPCKEEYERFTLK